METNKMPYELALQNLEHWADIVGVIPKETSHYFELETIVRESFKLGQLSSIYSVGFDFDIRIEWAQKRLELAGKKLTNEQLEILRFVFRAAGDLV